MDRGGLMDYVDKIRRALLNKHAIHVSSVAESGKQFDPLTFAKSAQSIYKETSMVRDNFSGISDKGLNLILREGSFIGAGESIFSKTNQAGEGLYYPFKNVMEMATKLPMDYRELNLGAGNVDTTFAGVYRHELGHHQYYNFPKKERQIFRILSEPFVHSEQEITNSFGSKHKISLLPEAGFPVSVYAAHSPSELFAESFSAYTSPLYQGGLPEDLEYFMKRKYKKFAGGRWYPWFWIW
jgi:hypothetical protein